MERMTSSADQLPFIREQGSVPVRSFAYAKGRHSLIRGSMVLWTWATLPSLRLRFELLLDARWRKPGLRRRILPVAVTLNRRATDFFVLRRAMLLGIGRRTVGIGTELATVFRGKFRAFSNWRLFYRYSSSISPMLSPSMMGSSLSMAAAVAARFFAWSVRIFSSTVSRAMSL